MVFMSVKMDKIKVVAMIVAVILIVGVVAVAIPLNNSSTDVANIEVAKENAKKMEKINYKNIKSNEDRVKFLAQFNWAVDPNAVEVVEVTIPKEFPEVYTKYNEIQLLQGLDLKKFAGKKVKRCTYFVTNYPNAEGIVNANLIIYKNQVIGGDICSTEMNGFMHGFMPSTLKVEGEIKVDIVDEVSTDVAGKATGEIDIAINTETVNVDVVDSASEEVTEVIPVVEASNIE